MADDSMTGTFQITLPKEILVASTRISPPKNDQLRVEGWRSSWLTKISELFVGKD